MSNDTASVSPDDITSSDAPQEDVENLDVPGEVDKDTGDEPTESDDDLDAPGEGDMDTGDEA
jgi:hypothetical protein